MTSDQKISLSRGEKLLLVIYELSGASQKSVRFEDIVVKAFKNYPQDFCLKGYPEYPDSGLHEPLYLHKKKGLLVVGSKMFALTGKGLAAADKLHDAISGKSTTKTDRLSRDIEKEIARIIKTSGFKLFMDEELEQVVDTDFFEYIGTTVRSTRNDFLGRLNTVKDVIKETASMDNPIYLKIANYNDFMMDKFQEVVDYKQKH